MFILQLIKLAKDMYIYPLQLNELDYMNVLWKTLKVRKIYKHSVKRLEQMYIISPILNFSFTVNGENLITSQ